MVGQQEKIRTILGLCARARGHRAMYEMLRQEVETYIDRDLCLSTLIHHAERQGVAPLLNTHLAAIDLELPPEHHRILRSLYQRSRHANRIRNRVMAEILETLNAEGIHVLLVKGIALANTVYEEAGLRPMRDIDILVRTQDLDPACSILADYGFTTAPHQIADDYYHLPPLHKTVNGLPVTIEIHHELLPRQAPYPVWTFDSFSHELLPFSINGTQADTIYFEANLYYLYLHGIKAPLTYEPLRLIHVADLVSLTECCCRRIDWERVEIIFPQCKAVLSQLHFITPWEDALAEELQLDTTRPPRRPPRPYRGWPLEKIKDAPLGTLPRLMMETAFPSSWWLQVYYSRTGRLPYCNALLFEHPRNIWRWIKTYSRARFARPASSSQGSPRSLLRD